MFSKEVKKCSVSAKLMPNKLTERDDDCTCNVLYDVNRTIRDICRLVESSRELFASERKRVYAPLSDSLFIILQLENGSYCSNVAFLSSETAKSC